MSYWSADSPLPHVTIHKYPEADHAFARIGGITYHKAEADEAFEKSAAFFERHLQPE
jgi:carboxymethylenebutenolidase